jgi:Zn-dependent protease with chaperone function
MNQEKFSALVDRLEGYARKHPTAYKIRVGMLAAIGYIYIFVIVTVLLLLISAVLVYVGFNWLVIKILWIPLVLTGIALRSLWVSFPEPDGLHLKYEDVPALFDLVREIESAIGSPRVHHILLADDFNAAVVQIPRLGFFGWQKNYLLLGLPIMQALSPEEFRAVIAHELGHLSGAHSRFAGWIYRVRQTWVQLVTRLQEERRHGSFIFERFLNWYAPFFNAYSFVLARAQEYEADARAVELAGGDHAARALINLELKGRFLEEDFWPKFYRQADTQSEPPADVFTQFVSATQRQLPQDTARKWFLQVLAVPTGYEDTHPSLADRLAAIGYPRSSAPDAEYQQKLLSSTGTNGENAAQYYLGQIAESFMSSRNRWWKEQVAPLWRERYKYVQEAQQRLQKLRAKEQAQPLTVEEQWEMVRCLAETQGSAAALPKVHEMISACPDHAGANFALGQILIEQNDEVGIEYLEKAMSLEPDTVLPGCELIYLFLKEQERDKEAESYRLRAQQHYKAIQAAETD